MTLQTSTAATVASARTLELVKSERVPPAFALPDIPELQRVPRRIDAEDEGELRWYLRGPAVASIAHSSGAFGNQLEIASAFGFGSLPCRRCGGKFRARKRGAKETIVDWRDGTGLAPKDHFGKRVTYAAALADYRKRMQREHRIVLSSKPTPKPETGLDAEQLWQGSVAAFKAQGKRLMTDAAFRSLFDRLPESLCQPCRPCQGIGVVPRRAAAHVEVTAYPTGSSKHGSGKPDESMGSVKTKNGRSWLTDGPVTVSFTEIERYREMHTALADVAKLSPIALYSLEEYYRDENGQRALEAFVEERFGLTGAARMRAASALRDHQCACFNLASYGAQ